MAAALPFYVEPTDPPSKQELLKAALKLFARDGVRESSIRAVAAEAGFTNPVLFKYFDGKEALALYLFERCYLRLMRETKGALAEGDVTPAIDHKLLVAGFWGLLGQFARMHAFGEWRGRAVDAAPQLEALV